MSMRFGPAPPSELDAERSDEHLVAGARIEPECAEREASEHQLCERSALHTAIASIDARALRDESSAQPLDGRIPDLAPGIEVVAVAFLVVADVFTLDVEVELLPRETRFE